MAVLIIFFLCFVNIELSLDEYKKHNYHISMLNAFAAILCFISLLGAILT